MNPDTMHMIRTQEGQELPVGYIPVPQELQADANRVLAGRDEAYLSKHSRGSLGQWATKQRKAHRRRQQAAASRRRNRG